MSYKHYKENLAKHNQLAAVDVLGSFDFYTCIVSFDAIDSRRIRAYKSHYGSGMAVLESDEAFSPDIYGDLSAMVPLIAHEHTHFVDATSTLWGLGHLVSMSAAYASHETYTQDESQFYHAKLFFDKVRRLKLPDYYTSKYDADPNRRPWRWEMSIGKAFSSDGKISGRPILFSRFMNIDGKSLVRSPLSTVSLLEASAMAQKVWAHMSLIECCEPDFRTVELARYSERTLDYLYDKELTEYSVCVHVVANLQQCEEILSAFALTAKLIRVALNFPQALFDEVLQHCKLHELVGVPQDSSIAALFADGIRLKDRGILFYLMALALPAISFESLDAVESGVVSSLETLGVSWEKLVEAGNDEANQLCEQLLNSRFRAIQLLGEAGHFNFLQINRSAAHLPFDELEMPEVYLGDAESVRIFRKPDGIMNELSVEDCFNELYPGQEWITRFAEACIWHA